MVIAEKNKVSYEDRNMKNNIKAILAVLFKEENIKTNLLIPHIRPLFKEGKIETKLLRPHIRPLFKVGKSGTIFLRPLIMPLIREEGEGN